MNDGLPKIERPYLMICPIPHYVHPDGSIWLDPLWHHDLAEHLQYLRNFSLLSPARDWSAELDLVRLEIPADVRFEIIPVSGLESFKRALFGLPRLIIDIWRAVGRAEIVHSGIAGWPFPLGWIANPIALVRRRHLVINVESAFWRIPKGQRASLKDRLREVVSELLGRFYTRRAGLSLFSQPSYRDSLLGNSRTRSYITPASWISEQDILSQSEAERSWDDKLASGEARFLFAGRLVPDKGIDVLLDALAELDARGTKVGVDIIGEGPRRDACLAARSALSSVSLGVLEPVPYGEAFFGLVRRYHAVLVPSLSDEQPRLVLDAFAQSVPILATATDGLTPHVIEGETGHLCPAGDASALAAVIERAAAEPAMLRPLGMNALSASRSLTHSGMHRTRWRLLVECFGAG